MRCGWVGAYSHLLLMHLLLVLTTDCLPLLFATRYLLLAICYSLLATHRSGLHLFALPPLHDELSGQHSGTPEKHCTCSVSSSRPAAAASPQTNNTV